MRRLIALAGCILLVLGVWWWPPGSRLVERFTLDGHFDDWEERACLSDSPREAGGGGKDFRQIAWGTNPNEQKLYFMIERYPAGQRGMTCRLYLDINGNGSYEDRIDKFAELYYKPDRENAGKVIVGLYSVAGTCLASYRGDWGEGYGKGGRRCEFALPMKDLQVYSTQPIRFYLAGIGSSADRLPDEGDVQWAPFPVTVKARPAIAVGALLWLGITVFLYRQRIWIFYYIWGAVGLTFVLILLLRGSLVEYWLEQQISLALHHLLGYLGIVTHIFDKAPGTLLVVIKVDNSWTTFDVDIESSGLLEMCIFAGLVMFYPVYSRCKRLMITLGGLLAVSTINLLRLLLVIVTIYLGGRNMSFIAHTLIGRVFFFVLIIALYWQVITRPTLQKVKELVKND